MVRLSRTTLFIMMVMLVVVAMAIIRWTHAVNRYALNELHPITGIFGVSVNSSDDRPLGRVLDITSDTDGRPEYLIVLQGGRERLSSLIRVVPWSTVTMHRSDGGLTLSIDAARFFNSPRYSNTAEISVEEEIPKVNAYFGQHRVSENSSEDPHNKS